MAAFLCSCDGVVHWGTPQMREHVLQVAPMCTVLRLLFDGPSTSGPVPPGVAVEGDGSLVTCLVCLLLPVKDT